MYMSYVLDYLMKEDDEGILAKYRLLVRNPTYVWATVKHISH